MCLIVWGASRTLLKENPVGDVFAEKFTSERKKVGSRFGLQDLRQESPTRFPLFLVYTRFFLWGTGTQIGNLEFSVVECFAAGPKRPTKRVSSGVQALGRDCSWDDPSQGSALTWVLTIFISCFRDILQPKPPFVRRGCRGRG